MEIVPEYVELAQTACEREMQSKVFLQASHESTIRDIDSYVQPPLLKEA
jgi:hypothetical protein